MSERPQVDAKRPQGLVALVLVGFVRGYQLTLSALIGRRCRYLPTCSDYAMEAMTRHGAWRGLWLGAGRVCRCHPWGGDGFDPVPDTLPQDWRIWRRSGRR
jgi:putative membrane protein insertion efficiency factor